MKLKWLILLSLFSLFLLYNAQVFAQAPATGSIKGKVKDSTYKFVLSSATVAVYKLSDSTLLQFCIPNNFGEFSLSKLPFNDSLRMQITHTGYPPYEKIFLIQPDKNPLDFGWIYMHQHGKELEEVVVAPVRMNGDTLEFNPRLFKMDANATAEDLMRRLPGFQIWGDGEITFNGKKITALFVDGKPFLGGTDITTATQNLPKEALDKIQVYQQRDEKNPLDSTLMANLKLKENKKIGYFGKAAVGYGTGKRYAADAMLTGFNKKMQASLVGAGNNINKLANSTDELIKISSFKGEGNNLDYQPNFSLPGLNRPITAGAKFQYDFIPDPDYQKGTSRLNADYFLNHNNTLINRKTAIYTFLKPDSILTRNTDNVSNTIYTNQTFTSRYNRDSKKYSFTISTNGGVNQNQNINTSTDQQERTGEGIISNGWSNTESKNLSRSARVMAEYQNREDWYSYGSKAKRVPRTFSVRYSFGINDNAGNSSNRSAYSFINEPAANRSFDRLYAQKDSRQLGHNVYVGYPGVWKLIFGPKIRSLVDIGISADANFNDNNFRDKVLDFDTSSKKYIQNNYLSNTRYEHINNVNPQVTVSKQFYKSLTNRFNKSLSLQFTAKQQYYSMLHHALLPVQNFNYRYSRFLPQASVNYINHQYGSHEIRSSLFYSTNMRYPDVNMIAPLVDSSNLWYIPMGNRAIRPEYNSNYSFSFELQSRKPKNPHRLAISGGFTATKDKIADSTLYDNTGKMLAYNVNVSGFKSWRAGMDFRKAYSPNKQHTFEFTSVYNLNRSVSPQYINKLQVISKSFYHTINADLLYTHKDIVTAKLEQGLNLYNSKQNSNGGNVFKSENWYTRASGSLQFPQKLVWSTNITFNKSTSGNSREPIKFTIWNASATYRFMKGNQGEIKFSALDLLKQNKSVINTGNLNMQTFGYSNVLQQYFMLTLAYYPRKFGKRK